MGRVRRCDSQCHRAKGKRCICWCGGRYHGQNGTGAVHRQELFDGIEKLEDHGFVKGETVFKAQVELPIALVSGDTVDG